MSVRTYVAAKGTCPHAAEVSEHLISLPLHMWLTDEDVQKIIEVVNNFLK
jgi:dTDP-4-amino-4,6-dideoxygalactose transaminase